MKVSFFIAILAMICLVQGKDKDRAEILASSASTWQGYDSQVNHRAGYKGYAGYRAPRGYAGYDGSYHPRDYHQDNLHPLGLEHHDDYAGYAYGSTGYYNQGYHGGYPARSYGGHSGYYGRPQIANTRYNGYW